MNLGDAQDHQASSGGISVENDTQCRPLGAGNLSVVPLLELRKDVLIGEVLPRQCLRVASFSAGKLPIDPAKMVDNPFINQEGFVTSLGDQVTSKILNITDHLTA